MADGVLRVASWDVEHFGDGDPTRVTQVFEFLAAQNPDGFAVCEVEGSQPAEIR